MRRGDTRHGICTGIAGEIQGQVAVSRASRSREGARDTKRRSFFGRASPQKRKPVRYSGGMRARTSRRSNAARAVFAVGVRGYRRDRRAGCDSSRRCVRANDRGRPTRAADVRAHRFGQTRTLGNRNRSREEDETQTNSRVPKRGRRLTARGASTHTRPARTPRTE
jgi:hypothetical protein